MECINYNNYLKVFTSKNIRGEMLDDRRATVSQSNEMSDRKVD